MNNPIRVNQGSEQYQGKSLHQNMINGFHPRDFGFEARKFLINQLQGL